MPGGDQSGPMGAGPMTGRGMGRCAGYAAPGFAGAGQGRGMGRGRGGYGRGFRNRWVATGVPGWARGDAPAPTRDEEREDLKRQADYLERSLRDVRERLAGMDAETQAQ